MNVALEYKKLFVEGGSFYEFAHIGWGGIIQQWGGIALAIRWRQTN